MSLYKKILVAVDASDEATQVLAHVAAQPWVESADVSVIHVAEHPPLAYGQWMVYLPIDESELVERLHQRMRERITAAGLKATASTVEFGRPIDTILEIAEGDGADLIVLGSHGRHGIQRVLGSTANGVLHRATCDVMAVRIRD